MTMGVVFFGGITAFLVAYYAYQSWQDHLTRQRIERLRDKEDAEVSWLDDLFFHTPAVEPWRRWTA